ncbi:HNH endonuclease [Paracoccus kondratievae]|nr:HNH endonuclease [Paracoccus kondratievae]
MGRLQAAPARFAKAAPRIATAGEGPDRLRRRDQTVHWRRWYKTAEWQRLRWSCLEAARFTCVRCGFVSRSPRASDMVADHKLPHRGDRGLFFDPLNLQCLCSTCHNRDKQREERRHV